MERYEFSEWWMVAVTLLKEIARQREELDGVSGKDQGKAAYVYRRSAEAVRSLFVSHECLVGTEMRLKEQVERLKKEIEHEKLMRTSEAASNEFLRNSNQSLSGEVDQLTRRVQELGSRLPKKMRGA